ncbi:hypothetical protein B0H13DRAFT_1856591 [Mycena leptocephala]|nr:hypothetical protein B0H13DRAFT_1903509 [Mycena leptocephala]KAJ7932981.1 hypothetical protein B0H13DRAFT_1856591 [Mycena leptocephala]
MAPLYPTLLFLALVSQFKPNLAKNHARLQHRQAVNETCVKFCTPEILELDNLALDGKGANATTCTDAIAKQFAECTQCQTGYVTVPYGEFLDDCQTLGFPVKDVSDANGIVPGFNPSSSSSGVDSQLAYVPQCACYLDRIIPENIFSYKMGWVFDKSQVYQREGEEPASGRIDKMAGPDEFDARLASEEERHMCRTAAHSDVCDTF